MGRLQVVEESAFQIAHELPQRHTITRRFRGARFRKATEHFLRAVYDLEWEHFRSPRDFQFVGSLIAMAIATIELHVLETYSERHDSECRFFSEMITRLRDANDAVHQGWPPNPEKRPTQQALEGGVDERLTDVIRRHASARGTPDRDRARAGTGSAR